MSARRATPAEETFCPGRGRPRGRGGPGRSVAAQMAEHAPDGPFEHVANLAGLQSSEWVPLELGRVLMVRAVEKQHAQMRSPWQPSSPRVETEHRVNEDASECAQKRSVLGKPSPPREREAPFGSGSSQRWIRTSIS